MTHRLNRTTDTEIMTKLARAILERVFESLKPNVSTYPNGIEIGTFFIRPEEGGLRFDLLVEEERDPDPCLDPHPDSKPEVILDYRESCFSLHEAITRALILQLEPAIEITAFDLIATESKKAS